MSSNGAAYGSYTHGSARSHGRSHPSGERRSSDGENQNAYAQSSQYMPVSPLHIFIPHLADILGVQDSYMVTSTLSGAMGDANMSHSRSSRSPASSHSGSVYAGNVPQNQEMNWTSQLQSSMMISSNASTYPGVPGHGGLFGVNHDLSINDFASARKLSPESLSPPSPYTHGNGQLTSGMMGFPGSMNVYPSSPQESRSDADTIRHLQRRVRELEQECNRTRNAFAMGHANGLPNAPASAQFQGQWRMRTDARKRIFCSLNRAGNALCSWHDSRRERRMFPPRNAPAGFLNCGCTYDEALFEESLARHGVGSYHPGENVRMDPALRNPLLKLLVQRYGYKDGDFDHDPLTETWNAGEDPGQWEQKAQSGALMRRRNESSQ